MSDMRSSNRLAGQSVLDRVFCSAVGAIWLRLWKEPQIQNANFDVWPVDNCLFRVRLVLEFYQRLEGNPHRLPIFEDRVMLQCAQIMRPESRAPVIILQLESKTQRTCRRDAGGHAVSE